MLSLFPLKVTIFFRKPHHYRPTFYLSAHKQWLCLAHHTHLSTELRLGGVESRATYGATYGTLGVDVHRQFDVVYKLRTTIRRSDVLGVGTAVAASDVVV